jgi:NAD(P)-dependent dehydrogenase (short-subunit alcohol dehydrogenase family)
METTARPKPPMLQDKVILVTGAGRGVGRAHALELASNGARVVVNDIGADMSGEGVDNSLAELVVKEIEAAGGSAVASHDDISTWTGAQAAVQRGVTAFGRLEGMVNNAGNQRRGPLADLREEDFDAIVRVHLKGTFGCTVHALHHWRDRAAAGEDVRASIVQTFSDAVLVSLPNYAVYEAAKAGIAQLTTTASREAASYGVRVNAYGPRALTRMTPGADQIDRSRPHPMDERNSSPLIVWLLSEQSAHVTGQIFQTVGGGIGLCTPWRTGAMVWPEEGNFRFEPDEIGAVLNAQIFHSRYPNLKLPEPPGFSAELRNASAAIQQKP